MTDSKKGSSIFKRLAIVLLASFILTLVTSAGTTLAAADTCYWVGLADANWDVAGNWDTTSSGGGGGDCDGGTYPGSDDSAIFDSGNIANATLNVNTVGTMTMSSGFTASVTASYAGTTTFSGVFTQADGTFNAGSNTVSYNSTINLTGGTYDVETATLISNYTGANAVYMNGGTLDASTADVDLNGTASAASYLFNIDNGTFTAPGSANSFTTADSIDITPPGIFDANNGTIIFDGTDLTTLVGAETTFHNITFSMPSGIARTYWPITLDGDFKITSSVYEGNTFAINLGGDFITSGTGSFTPNTSTINMNGTDQAIYGTNSFYNLTKQTAGTWEFEAGETQTVTGTWTAEGTGIEAGALFLRSTVSDSTWTINPQSTRTLDYIDVKDSINSNAAEITLSGKYANDSGTNTNWNFASSIPFQAGAALIPEFSTYMLMITFLIGMGMIQKKFKPEIKQTRY